jgi:hypothetical protein
MMSEGAYMQEIDIIKNHRWSGLWNGVVIGMGVGYLLSGILLGILPIVMGLGIEFLQRKRLNNTQ